MVKLDKLPCRLTRGSAQGGHDESYEETLAKVTRATGNRGMMWDMGNNTTTVRLESKREIRSPNDPWVNYFIGLLSRPVHHICRSLHSWAVLECQVQKNKECNKASDLTLVRVLSVLVEAGGVGSTYLCSIGLREWCKSDGQRDPNKERHWSLAPPSCPFA